MKTLARLVLTHPPIIRLADTSLAMAELCQGGAGKLEEFVPSSICSASCASGDVAHFGALNPHYFRTANMEGKNK